MLGHTGVWAHGVVGYHARLAYEIFKYLREVLGSIPNVSICFLPGTLLPAMNCHQLFFLVSTQARVLGKLKKRCEVDFRCRLGWEIDF